MKKKALIKTESDLQTFANHFAAHCPKKLVVYLQGDLGSGKTTFVRCLLRGLNYQGKVKSPTYTLVEPYQVGDKQIYHFDLYRVNDSEELEYIGIRDFADRDAICFVEWPEKGGEHLPLADLHCNIRIEKDEARLMIFEAKTPAAEALLAKLD